MDQKYIEECEKDVQEFLARAKASPGREVMKMFSGNLWTRAKEDIPSVSTGMVKLELSEFVIEELMTLACSNSLILKAAVEMALRDNHLPTNGGAIMGFIAIGALLEAVEKGKASQDKDVASGLGISLD